MKVRIERYYSYPDILRQTPNNLGVWEGVEFTEDKIEECDYLIILEYPRDIIRTNVNPQNIFHICQEPPNEMSRYRQYSNKLVNTIFSQKTTSERSLLSHGALPWHVNKNYDFLKSLNPSDLIKEDVITWVTSNLKTTLGHKKRMEFMQKVNNINNLKIYGRGINPIDDKWSVLAGSKYSIAYENYQADYYWTEKISDCFLSYNMPLYVGSDSIYNYFPKESLIVIDPNEKEIAQYITSVLKSNVWKKNFDAIVYARELILDQYQLFPMITRIIKEQESKKGVFAKFNRSDLTIPGGLEFFDNYPLYEKARKYYYKLAKKILG